MNSRSLRRYGWVLLVLLHIGQYACPTLFAGDADVKPKPPHVVFVIGEDEYQTEKTLPAFAKEELERLGIRTSFVHSDADDKNHFPGLEVLKQADLLVLSVRRRSLPEKELAIIREYVDAGRPLVGIRTASHAFHTRGQHPEGHAEWQTFDPDVLGGSYTGHHGNELKTMVQVIPKGSHPILTGLPREPFPVGGSLYKVNPLKETCVPLLTGKVDGADAEPVAWTNTHKGGRVFYTSLGHPADFEIPAFRRLLANGIFWTLDREIVGLKD